jgi:hypothetical protein
MRRTIAMLAALLLAAPAVAQYLWCDDADVVRVDVDGATVTVIHEAAVYNCCPDPFQYDVSWEGDRLLVTEHEVLTYPCYCICCFDLFATVENAPPGEWVLVFTWWNYESNGWMQVEVPFTVEDVGQGGPALMGPTDDSGCLNSSDVDDVPTTTAWGQVKTIYR